MKTGIIVSHLGVKVLVEDQEHQRAMVNVTRKSGHVVGDRVEFDDNRLKRLPRKNSLSRKGRTDEQVVAANLDTVGIVVCAIPKTPRTFIDHALVACLAQNIKPFIVVNKSDLPDTADFYRELKDAYGHVLTIIEVSAQQGIGLDQLARYLSTQGRSVLIGVSGVGKSSLINALLPDAKQTTSADINRSQHGQHVTTVSNLFHLSSGGELIDTPGVRDFEPMDIQPLQLAHFFIGFEDALKHPCKFRDCLHQSEPGCSVRDAVDRGLINPERYRIYLGMLNK